MAQGCPGSLGWALLRAVQTGEQRVAPLTSAGSDTCSWVSGGALITITICSEGSTTLRRSWQVT